MNDTSLMPTLFSKSKAFVAQEERKEDELIFGLNVPSILFRKLIIRTNITVIY